MKCPYCKEYFEGKKCPHCRGVDDANQAREKEEAEHKFNTETLRGKFLSIMKDNEVLVCLKHDNNLYWKKIRFKNMQDVRVGWPMLYKGLEDKLKKLGVVER